MKTHRRTKKRGGGLHRNSPNNTKRDKRGGRSNDDIPKAAKNYYSRLGGPHLLSSQAEARAAEIERLKRERLKRERLDEQKRAAKAALKKWKDEGMPIPPPPTKKITPRTTGRTMYMNDIPHEITGTDAYSEQMYLASQGRLGGKRRKTRRHRKKKSKTTHHKKKRKSRRRRR